MQRAVRELEGATAHCTGFVVNICLSYGGRGELVRACRGVAVDVQQGRVASPGDISEQDIERHLCTAGRPGNNDFVRIYANNRNDVL